MNVAEATALLTSLLQRLEADASSARPAFGTLVSSADRQALRAVLEELGSPAPAHDQREPVDKGGGRALDESVLHADIPRTEWVLCLDFGTAKSKAFAATQEEEPDCLELAIGKADGDLDGSVYAVSSSVWIEDDGRAFVGSEAMRRGQRYDGNAQNRRRLDSLKQEISQVRLDGDVEGHVLHRDVNPTEVPLTVEDAVTFFLAYLTDLATTALEERIGERYARRRFTLPCWDRDQRQWASELIGRSLGRAQLLADTFRGQWRDGIAVDVLKKCIEEAAKHDEALRPLLDADATEGSVGGYSGGVLEPLAAASSRVWKDSAGRGLVLVVDVGAGTTDVSLFWSSQNMEGRGRHAFPVKPCARAIKQAGDTLDSLLVQEFLDRANLGADPALKERTGRFLYRSGVRLLKESLFEKGAATAVLVNGESITITLEEFLQVPGVARFADGVRRMVTGLLSEVHESWAGAVEGGLTLVLTGGGSGLPMMQALGGERWTVAGKEVGCRLARELPTIVKEEFDTDFQQEYPQLAVALGGSMPTLLEEGKEQEEWHGGTRAPGGLERYPTRGQ